MGKVIMLPWVKQTVPSTEQNRVHANALPKPAPRSGLAIGTRIYYGGDMANSDGFGTITERMEPTKYGGSQVHIAMDDERKMWVMEIGFSPEYKGHGGTRFVTEAAYNAFQDARIAGRAAPVVNTTRPSKLEEPAAPGMHGYYPEMGQKKPNCQIEARLGHYGKHYFVDTPLELKGRGIEHRHTLTASDLNNPRKVGWHQYKVTCKAFDKLKAQYSIARECLLD